FSIPTNQAQNNLGRNTLRSSPLRQLDATLSRSLHFDHLGAVLRLEAFNVLNIPNFGAPQAQLGLPTFGLPYQSWAEALGTGTLTQGGVAPVQQSGAPRSVQLALRLTW